MSTTERRVSQRTAVDEARARQKKVMDEFEADQDRERSKFEKRKLDAQVGVEQAQDALDDARRDANHAGMALSQFVGEHEHRLEEAHAGVDFVVSRAQAVLRDKTLTMATRLSKPTVRSTVPVQELASLYLAAQPEFAEALHHLLDEHGLSGNSRLSDLSSGDFEEREAELRAEKSKADAAVLSAQEDLARATAAFRSIE